MKRDKKKNRQKYKKDDTSEQSSSASDLSYNINYRRKQRKNKSIW